jgi:hypothetical protein
MCVFVFVCVYIYISGMPDDRVCVVSIPCFCAQLVYPILCACALHYLAVAHALGAGSGTGAQHKVSKEGEREREREQGQHAAATKKEDAYCPSDDKHDDGTNVMPPDRNADHT